MRFFNEKANKESEVPIEDELVRILKEYIDLNYNQIRKNKGKLFTISKFTVSHKMKEYFRKIGREDIRLHDLHHSFASYLANVYKVKIQVVSKLLDHSDIRITMNYYHKDEQTLRETLDNLNFF